MSKRMIAVKVDVTKVDKSRLFQGRNGAKYLDLVLIETPDGKFGDWMAVQGVSKEDRMAGVRGAILGNGKNLGMGGGKTEAASSDSAASDDNSDVPF